MEIWKFPLRISEDEFLVMPKKAVILSCQLQNEQIVIWAMCDERQHAEKRYFKVIGTGHQFNPKGLLHIASVQKGSGVFHVFEFKK